MAEPFLSSHWHRVAELAPRLRTHGQVRRHRYRGRSWYVIYDPSSGRVHRFTPVAYAFIRAMDGRASIDQIWTQMAANLEENAPTQDEIIRLLSQLFEADLLHINRLPHAEEFLRLIGRQRRSRLMNAIRNPLSLTFPLWDPNRFLDRTVGQFRALLGWYGLMAWIAVVAPALVFAVLYFRELTENITDRVLSTEGLVMIGLTFPVVKALHELGHAYALKALGGEVHQIGLMFIALYPIPYVDASPAAMLPSKGQRILISAAGMMVELVLAAIAMYVWMIAEPGVVRAVAFDVILIAGVSTLVVNGNPLLRYDGYFMLSDFLEIPNLAQRCTRFYSRVSMRLLFGLRAYEPQPSSAGEKAWYLFYGSAAYVYRMFILFSLSLFIASEYLIVGILLAAASLASATLLPLLRGVRRLVHVAELQSAGRRTKVRLSVACAGVAAALFAIPIPLHTNSEGVIWLPDNAYVRAGADGFVERVLMASGTLVQKGDLLIESQDSLLGMQIELRRKRIQELEVKLDSERFADRAL